MTSGGAINVTSHVARDLLASAAAYKNEASAVWEYVVNSIQYVDVGTVPIVNVRMSQREKVIEISDNGRGMNMRELRHYFTMHGENLERLAGRAGRGKFGTGKSAAFGIGMCLLVDSTQNGVRNVVQLTRSAIEKSDGSEIPVERVVADEPSDKSNGTRIVISEIFTRKLRINPVVEYIERNLQVYRSLAPQVAVNSRICEYRDPEVTDVFEFSPSAAQAEVIGDVKLTLRVAREPLDDSFFGVAVTAGAGNLVGRESCGIEKKTYGQSIFGEIDVPAIESTSSPIEPFDSTRSFKLNPAHPVVAVLIGFLGSKLESVRKKIADREKEAQNNERARRLANEANSIAEILNQDFNRMKDRLNAIYSGTSVPGPASSDHGSEKGGGSDLTDWAAGFNELGNLPENDSVANKGAGKNQDAPDILSRGEPDPDGKDSVDPVGGEGKNVRRPSGGFSVAYRPLGESSDRSKYESGTLTIVINTDHKVVAAALQSSAVEDPIFRRLSYEIAFSEYAIGLGHELLKHDPGMAPEDLLYDVRATLNRVSSLAVHLYT